MLFRAREAYPTFPFIFLLSVLSARAKYFYKNKKLLFYAYVSLKLNPN